MSKSAIIEEIRQFEAKQCYVNNKKQKCLNIRYMDRMRADNTEERERRSVMMQWRDGLVGQVQLRLSVA